VSPQVFLCTAGTRSTATWRTATSAPHPGLLQESGPVLSTAAMRAHRGTAAGGAELHRERGPEAMSSGPYLSPPA